MCNILFRNILSLTEDLYIQIWSQMSPFLFAVYLDDLSNLCSPFDACYIILYADDILLISPSVTNLERLLHRCEHELAWLDIMICPLI